MKTKLLKKIRKQYSIVYYPNGMVSHEQLYHVNKYVIYDKKGAFGLFNLYDYNTKQDAISAILKRVRVIYSKYSRSERNNYKGQKVWYK